MNIVNNLVNEEVNKFVGKRNLNLKESDFIRMVEMYSSFPMNEDESNQTEIVLNLIRNNQWEEQNPESFRNSLRQSKHMMMLTDYEISDLSQMKLFKLKDYNIGYALKDHNENHIVKLLLYIIMNLLLRVLVIH